MKSPFAKIELHSHLEGTITAATLIELSRSGRFPPLPASGEEELEKILRVSDFKSFNAYMDLIRPFRQRPEDVARIARAEFARAAKNGVVYAEYRFNFDGPVLAGYDLHELIEAVNGERARAKRETGLMTGLIFGVKRRGDVGAVSEMVAAGIEAFAKGHVCGLDLNGDEKAFPVLMFRDCFRKAVEAGCPLTLHAGEWDGPGSVRDAVACGARRIGHGVRAAEDPSLVELLAREKICLEICPTSNICTGVYRSYSENPLRKLFEAGVPVSVNSDDHGAFGSDIDGEYSLLEKEFGFSAREIEAINLSAARSAFLSDRDRRKVIDKLTSAGR